MATNKSPYLRNLYGAPDPEPIPLLFQAGSSAAICSGELITPNTSDQWIALAADQAMFSSIAIAAEEIASGDRAGYYKAYAPRPGDVWEFELATAAAVTFGSYLYYSTSQKLTTSGTYPIAVVVGTSNYPVQGHLSKGVTPDEGTTIRSLSYVQCMILPTVSYFNAVERRGNTWTIVADCTAGGAEDEVVLVESMAPSRITDAWLIARDTNSANVYLKTSTGTFTDTLAKSGTDDTITRFTKIIAEYDNVAAGDSITANFSGAAAVTVVVTGVYL